MIGFLNGVTTAACLAVGVLFFRLWRDTRDRFFVLFGLAFWMLALSTLLVFWAAGANEHQHYLYLGRLGAFLLIIAAIIDKNLSSGRSRP